MKRAWRRLESERGSVYAEYAIIVSLITLVAVSAFLPGSAINEGIGSDYTFREVLIKLPIF